MNKEMQENKVLCDICGKNESDLSMENTNLNIKVEFCKNCINNNYSLATHLLLYKVKIASLEEENKKISEDLLQALNENEFIKNKMNNTKCEIESILSNNESKNISFNEGQLDILNRFNLMFANTEDKDLK